VPRSIVIVTAVALVAVSVPASAQACSCAGPPKGGQRDFYLAALKQADAAIIGKVIDRRLIPEGGVVSGPGRAVVVYRVRRAFKKKRRFPRGRKVAVHTSGDGASCGIEQRVGSVGGIFLDRSNGRWRGSLCSQVSRSALRRAARDSKAKGASGAHPGGCAATAANG
jgi:hypothetical protein